MTKPAKWEVVDSYGIPVFTGTLKQCGIWIDPILGVTFKDGMNGWKASDDADRVTLNDDGNYIVDMYEGMGQLMVRPL